MDSGSLNRPGMVPDQEKIYQKYEAIKEEYESLRNRYADLIATHSGTANKLELSQEEVNRVKKLYEEALQETSTAIRERNGLKQQCTAAIRQWDSALSELQEYKEALQKVQQQHEEAMKEINQAMAVRIKTNKDIKRLTEERDAALAEYSLIMSERDSVHRELEKLTDDLGQAKKQIKSLETQNKELSDKVAEAVQEAEVSKRRRDWAFSERDKIVRERESLRTLCDRLRRERDRAVSDLAEALSESEDIKKQKNLASKQLKELRERIETEKENRSMRFQYLSNSSSFSESRDSAIDSDMPSGHYSIKLPNIRGADHGLVLEPGVYISRIIPGSPAAKDSNINIGDRVLYINDTPIDNVQEAIIALSEDIDPIMLTLSRSAGHLPSPMNTVNHQQLGINTVPMPKSSKNSAQMASSNSGGTNASTSSLKSDKSDPLSPHHSGSIVNQSTSSGRSRYGKTGLREILKVKLSSNRNKKLSSPEEAILATLDSAIDSGAAGSSNNNNTYRKTRKKRSGRSGSGGGGSDNVNRNGTWPRVLANRANNSYTLPHNNGAHGNQLGIPEGNNRSHNSGGGGDSSGGDPNMRHDRTDSSSFYGPYSLQSNTVCVRRKERPPISSLIWESLSGSPNPAKSLGAIASALPSGSKGNTARLSEGGNTVASAVIQPPHHRYSFGVFDPNSAGKMNKNAPERNSVVPMLTMSDGSSIDFSVKSGNTEILDYYVKRMGKNQNNSSESDHLDKVVTPPSLVLPNPSLAGTNNPSSILRHSNPSPLSVGVPVTLDRFTSRFGTYANPRYSAHHHDNVGPIISMTTQGNPVVASSTLPLAIPKPNAFSFEPSSYHHTHSHRNSSEQPSSSSASMSITSSSGGPGNKVNLFRNSDDLLLHPSYPFELPGTFPRNREPQRIRIPSNQSVTSRSSAEKFDLRNSPMPLYHIEVTDPSNPAGPADFSSWSRKPTSGEVRQVRIDKYDKVTEPLGIQISCKKNGGGVFVSSVTDNSLASQVGLQVGDQLLEVCGINMRSATYDLAANVLRQCGDSITMLVQYSPAKYREGVFDDDGSSSDHDSNSHSDGESSSEHDDENNSSMSDNESHSSAHSGSPTPCNSPQSTLVRNSKKNSSIHAKNGSNVSSSGATGPGSASVQTVPTAQMMNKMVNMTIGGTASLKKGQPGAGMMSAGLPSEQGQGQQQSNTQQKPQQNQFVGGGDKGQGESSLRSSVRENSSGMEKPRYLTLQLMKNSANLGICLVGGNVVGIFVHSVQHDSIANRVGLRTGDQILEYNGTDLRRATAEEAAFELAKPLDKVGILVQYNIQRYNEIKDQPGDGFYIRCLFDWPILAGDHQAGNPDPQQLSFRKDEILYVDNTMFNGKPGRWRAWKVDAEGHRRVWGVIPSKFKVEEDLMFKRSLGDMDSDRRTSTVTRRSFFRRKSHHRSSSRELASFSDFSINSYGDLSHGGLQLKDDSNLLVPSSYQRVERLEYMLFLRPVIILGALSDVIAERLVMDFPYQFGRAALEVMNCTGAMLEKGLDDNIFLDYKRKGSHYECVTMAAIKEISAKKLYCILDVSTAGVERLQRAQMYPIVLLVKFKNAKQIREIKDLRCDKISVKAAKELYDHSLKVENEYKHLITTCVPGGTNISYMATQVKTAVEKEQSKTLWVPV